MAEILDSAANVLLDTLPIQVPSAGEGAPGYMRVQTDQVAPAAPTLNSTYRLARFPVEAKVKNVWLFQSGIDSNVAATAKMDINVAFSDSAYDGTGASLQSQVPTSANTGATTPPPPGAYASPNKLFGSAVPTLNSGAVQYLEVTYKGAYLPQNQLLPMWNYFGFVNNQGLAQSPGGMFDILIVLSTGPATAAAGNIGVEVDFVI